jgi:hypothetical protein
MSSILPKNTRKKIMDTLDTDLAGYEISRLIRPDIQYMSGNLAK